MWIFFLIFTSYVYLRQWEKSQNDIIFSPLFCVWFKPNVVDCKMQNISSYAYVLWYMKELGEINETNAYKIHYTNPGWGNRFMKKLFLFIIFWIYNCKFVHQIWIKSRNLRNKKREVELTIANSNYLQTSGWRYMMKSTHDEWWCNDKERSEGKTN